jgi:hypothetical protein
VPFDGPTGPLERLGLARAAGLEPSQLGFASLLKREPSEGGLLGGVSAFEPIATLHGMPAPPGQHRASPGRIRRVESEPSCSADQDGEPPRWKIVRPSGLELFQQPFGPPADGSRQIREVVPSVPSLIFLEAINAHREILSRPPERPIRG